MRKFVNVLGVGALVAVTAFAIASLGGATSSVGTRAVFNCPANGECVGTSHGEQMTAVAGTTAIKGSGGNDEITVGNVSGNISIWGGYGDDKIYVSAKTHHVYCGPGRDGVWRGSNVVAIYEHDCEYKL